MKIGEKSLYEKLVYESEKFSYTRAMDIVYKVCSPKHIEIKNNWQDEKTFTDISMIEGLKDGIAEVYVNMHGLEGVEKILPDCYIEEYIQYNHVSQEAVVDFLDIFNERLLMQRYKYMKRQDITSLSEPIEKTVIGNIICNLAGFDLQTRSKQLPQQLKISAQNLFWRYTRSSSGLKVILSSFFKVPIEIKQFEGKFIKTQPGEQTVIGTNGKYNKLGRSSFLSDKIWDTACGITILVGALNFEQYMEFLPKSSTKDQKFSALEKMKKIVRLYVPNGINVTLHFFLDECFVKKTVLNGVNRLNKDTFISGIHSSKDAFFIERV